MPLIRIPLMAATAPANEFHVVLNAWIRLCLNGSASRGFNRYGVFSQLRRFDVTDEQGQRARLTDLGVALLDADYPPVTNLFFLNPKKQKRSLSWDQVQAIDLRARRISVINLNASQKSSMSGSLAKEVLLGIDNWTP
jgi:hypothetical protein